MVSIQQGLRDDGFEVSMVKLCRWFGVARRTMYYRPTKAPPTVKPELVRCRYGNDANLIGALKLFFGQNPA